MATKPATLDEANSTWLPFDPYLGGGFKYFLFSPLLGEMMNFD